MAEAFYNPYQFIPVTGQVNGSPTPTVPFETIKQGENPAVRHDLWQKDCHSGRIVCKVRLETPTVVGNLHQPPAAGEDRETLVRPYRIGDQEKGELALPASSLRGMVASVAESLSQSALKRLEPKKFSVRKQAGEGLSAIGMLSLETHPVTGKMVLRLIPLTLPMIDLNADKGYIPKKWQEVFAGRTLAEALGAYVDGYQKVETADGSVLRVVKDSFLDADGLESFHAARQHVYVAKINETLRTFPVTKRLDANTAGLKCIAGRYVLGQVIEELQAKDEFESKASKTLKKASAEIVNRHYRKHQEGILRILGIDKRETEIPPTKRHERFIPYSKSSKVKSLRINKSAFDKFLALAEERKHSSQNEKIPERRLPFLPQGYLVHKNEDNYWKPQPGELVFFDIDDQGRVKEISYSSIWRKPIEGSIHDAFAAIGPNLLPWGFGGRDHLTPAESLFGVVEGRKDRPTPDSRNLASRVRFSDARSPNEVKQLDSGEDDGAFLLKILSSPKPPSPALYFRGGPRKQDLRLSREGNGVPHQPNGRKVYLPHDPARAGLAAKHRPEWESRNTEHPSQKIRCRPLEPGQYFYFTVDFDNLTDAELTLLLAALEPDFNPASGFVHRLGLGKPLGLGSVSLKVGGVFLIDRIGRYDPDALKTQARFRWRLDAHVDDELCRAAAGLCLCPSSNPESRPWSPDESLIDADSREILKTVGNRRHQPGNRRVHYPFCTQEQVRDEKEGYEWFVSNDKPQANRQCLAPVDAGKALPVLDTHRRP